MAKIDKLLEALDERKIAQRINIPHDEARMGYSLTSNTVGNSEEFDRIISDYFNKHYTKTVSFGGRLPTFEAKGKALEMIEREYRRRNETILNAHRNAYDGTQGGMRGILDTIADGLKSESLERYIQDVFDRYVDSDSWEDKVEIIRQFIDRCGVDLGSSIDRNNPGRYAHDYRELIRAYKTALQRVSSIGWRR